MAFRLALGLPLLEPWCWIDGHTLEVGLQLRAASAQRPGELIYDLTTRTMRRQNIGKEEFVFESEDEGKRVYRIQSRTSNNTLWSTDYRAVFKRPDGTLRSCDFWFPGQPYPIDENLVAGLSFEQGTAHLYWRDLSEGQLQRSSEFQWQADTGHLWPATAGTAVVFTETPRPLSPPPASASAQAAPWQLPMATLDFLAWEANGPRRLWTQQVRNQESLCLFADNIYLIAPAGNELLCFDCRSLSWQASMPLPNELLQSISKDPLATVTLEEAFVVVRDATGTVLHQWSLPTLQKVHIPNSRELVRAKRDPRLAIAYDTEFRWFTVFELEQPQPLWTYRTRAFITGFNQSTNRDFILLTTPQYGITIDKLDLRSGVLLDRQRPLLWACWMLPLTVVLAWCWTQRASSVWGQSNRQRWILAVGLAVAYVGIFSTSVIYWELAGRPALQHNYLLAFCIASQALAVAWAVWGKGRLVVRCVPSAMVAGLALLLLRYTLAKPMDQQEALLMLTVVAVASWVLFAYLRWSGVRWDRTDSNSPQPRPITLSDLFLASSCAALLLAVTQPILVNAKIPRGVSPELLQALMAGSVLLPGLAAIMWAHFSGALVRLRWAIVVALLLVVLEAVHVLIWGEAWWLRRDAFPMVLIRITLAVWVVFHTLVGLVFPVKPVLPYRELPN